jgi:subtilisin family serine protease
MRLYHRLAAPVVLLGLAACMAEQPVATSTTTVPIRTALVTAGGGTGRHIVSFNGNEPAALRSYVAQQGGSVEWVSKGSGLAVVTGLSDAAADGLAKQKGIASVDADELIELTPAALDAEAAEAVLTGMESQAAPATAFFFPRQWNMRAIAADQAWAMGRTGSPSVRVAILDSGIDYTHADLVGLVDLVNSRDFTGTLIVNGAPYNEADTVQKYFPGRAPFTDLFYHGTHVAATVSSTALAAAGVTSRTTLVALKVCIFLNSCPFSSTLQAVEYAADLGVDVMNLSLGGTFTKAGNGRFVGLINKTFNYARSKGVTIVVSAGNSAIDLDHDGNSYKTYCSTPATICVAATGPTAQAGVNGPWANIDASADYTNYGRSSINVAAPGGNASTFVYAACSRTSLIVPVCGTGTFVIGVQGTSMASPHVSGAAALLAETLGRNPGAIRAALQQSADDLGQPGTDPQYGKGRLNVARAVGAIP